MAAAWRVGRSRLRVLMISLVLAGGASVSAAGLAADMPRPEAAAGELCLGIAGIACGKGLFCETEPGACQVADAAGKCEKAPQVCTMDYAPVCGCDGKTYGNDCARKAAGARLDHTGECRK